MPCHPSACHSDNLNFLFSHVFGRRATNTFETHACLGAEKINLECVVRVCVCVVCPIYSIPEVSQVHGRQVQPKDDKCPHAMPQCKTGRFVIC